ncbi:MAG: hypothetical protein WBX25_03985, partial [Rhodomicrobium sp.]
AIASGQRWIAGRNTSGPLVPRCNCDRAVLERKEKRSDANAGAGGIGALCTQWIDANGFPADGLESETTYYGEPVDIGLSRLTPNSGPTETKFCEIGGAHHADCGDDKF